VKVEVKVEDLTRIEAQPGDVFVYRAPTQLTAAVVAAIKAHWAGVFPDHPLLVQPTVAEPVAA
jgi:hypothetical protein